MIAKVPRWAWFGSAMLAVIAGMVNAVGFLGFHHQGLTHLTGITTLAGISLAGGDMAETAHLLAALGSFLGGCILSGFAVKGSALQLGRRYGGVLLAEAILLALAVPLQARANILGIYAASCAAGLQNGMLSIYSGAVLRTTHVTGNFTDLGISLGQMLRGLEVDRRRVRLCCLLIGSFFLGACLGTAAFARLSYATLYIPAALTGATGLGYDLYLARQRRRR